MRALETSLPVALVAVVVVAVVAAGCGSTTTVTETTTVTVSNTEPTGLAFHRMLARPDADPKALRDLHGRLAKALDWPFLLL